MIVLDDHGGKCIKRTTKMECWEPIWKIILNLRIRLISWSLLCCISCFCWKNSHFKADPICNIMQSNSWTVISYPGIYCKYVNTHNIYICIYLPFLLKCLMRCKSGRCCCSCCCCCCCCCCGIGIVQFFPKKATNIFRFNPCEVSWSEMKRFHNISTSAFWNEVGGCFQRLGVDYVA